MEPGIKFFLSYAHEDEAQKLKLEQHLSFLKHDGHVLWSDRQILAGQEVDKEIQKQLETADIILLLISPAFIASYYCYKIEMERAMQRHEAHEAVVIPVMLTDCEIPDTAPFAKLLRAPTDAKPIDNLKHWNTENEAMTDVAKQLKKVVADLKGKREAAEEQKMQVELLNTVINADVPTTLAPRPTSLFTGRITELEDFKQAFDSHNLLAVEALGGTGKTEFVLRFIEAYIPDKSKVIWWTGGPESKFNVLVQSAGYGYILQGENKHPFAVYSAFKDMIERDGKTLFIDNYQDIEDEAFAEFITRNHNLITQAKVVLLTKRQLNLPGIDFREVFLSGLSTYALEFARKVKGLSTKYAHIPDSDLETVCKKSDGHPLAIRLTIQLMSYGFSADEVFSKFLATGQGSKEIEKLTQRVFTEIFNHASTTESERSLLLNFSVFNGRVTRDAINFIGSPNADFDLMSLIDKLLISRADNYYETHPLVRLFSYEQLLADKKTAHSKAAAYYMSNAGEKFDPANEEQVFYHLIRAEEWEKLAGEIEKYGSKLLLIGQHRMLKDGLEAVEEAGVKRAIFFILNGEIADKVSDWRMAKEFYAQAMNQHDNIEVCIEGMVRFGDMLAQLGELRESLPYYEKAIVLAREHKFELQEASVNISLADIYRELNKLDISRLFMNDGLKIFYRLKSKERLGTALLHNSALLRDEGKFEEALTAADQCLQIFKETGAIFGEHGALNQKGRILYITGKYEGALTFHEESLQLATLYGSKSSISTSYNNMALVLGELKRPFEELLSLFLKALKIDEEIGDKPGMSTALGNIGWIYFKQNDYLTALKYLLHNLALEKQMHTDTLKNISLIFNIKSTIKKENFKKMITEAAQSLPEELRNLIPYSYLFGEPAKALEKPDRNDKVKVRYTDGSQKEGKFKKFEGDWEDKKCVVVEIIN